MTQTWLAVCGCRFCLRRQVDGDDVVAGRVLAHVQTLVRRRKLVVGRNRFDRFLRPVHDHDRDRVAGRRRSQDRIPDGGVGDDLDGGRIDDVDRRPESFVPAEEQDGDEDQDEDDGHVDDDQERHGGDRPGTERARKSALALVAVVREPAVLQILIFVLNEN